MTQEKFVVDLYIRVSTDRQVREGDSLEEQENELKKFCDYRNYHIHKTYIERGRSGGNTNRPEYQKLIKDIQSKKVNAVVVKKLDRLSRSLLDFEQLVGILQDNEVEFISLRENFDTTTAMGKAMLRVALVFAQLEREQTSERVKDVFSFRAEQGLFNGGVCPYGYDAVSKELIPNKQEKKVVEFMFNIFLKTKATSLVEQELNSMGFRNRKGRLWDRRHIDMVLKRPIYKGYIQWSGDTFKGIHQPLVSESKFDQVQQIFEERKTMGSRNKVKGLLKGLLICAKCHNYLSPNYTKKKNGSIYEYYRCASTFNRKSHLKCEGQYRPLKEVHELVIDFLLSYTTEIQLEKVQNQLDYHNSRIQKDLDLMDANIAKSQVQFETIKQKKEHYLDSLVTGEFSQKERSFINDKIDEFSLSEKQLETDIYRQTFQRTELNENMVNVDPFKEAILKFKLNHTSMSENELQVWLKDNIDQIILNQKHIKMSVKKLPFRLE